MRCVDQIQAWGGQPWPEPLEIRIRAVPWGMMSWTKACLGRRDRGAPASAVLQVPARPRPRQPPRRSELASHAESQASPRPSQSGPALELVPGVCVGVSVGTFQFEKHCSGPVVPKGRLLTPLCLELLWGSGFCAQFGGRCSRHPSWGVDRLVFAGGGSPRSSAGGSVRLALTHPVFPKLHSGHLLPLLPLGTRGSQVIPSGAQILGPV